MYPTRYQLEELTAHVVAALERRREAYAEWSEEAEQGLTVAAKSALAEAGKQFAEVADDPPYWQRIEHTILTAALPRYLQLAREEHEAQKHKYGVWRGGDLISRGVFAVAGLLGGALLLRFGRAVWLEPVPVAMFILGPLLPDLQMWNARRKYRNRLRNLVADMKDEADAQRQYRPLTEGEAPVDGSPLEATRSPTQQTRER